mgnify:CR=1 FL=1
MPSSEALRKAASLSAIGVVLAASVWLRPSPAPAPEVLPARIGTRPGVVIQSLRSESESESLFRVDSEPVQSQFRVNSDRGRPAVRPRVRPGSDPEYGATQLAGADVVQELRTLPARVALDGGAAPSAAEIRLAPPAAGHVSRAFATAGRHTAGGFKTAARALRSVF